ncbi:unnamed protein product, partial [marine sediment metagenome]
VRTTKAAHWILSRLLTIQTSATFGARLLSA